MPRRTTARAAVAAAAIAVIALTGCSAPGEGDDASAAPGSDQSVADACTRIDDVLNRATAGLAEMSADDPAASAQALRTISDGLGSAAAEVGNAEVASLLPDLRTAFGSAADAMEAVAAGDTDRAAELGDALSGVRDSVARFGELCGG
ncbi:MAG: hypothetical protein PGN24_08025 [Microbacterium arborescens]